MSSNLSLPVILGSVTAVIIGLGVAVDEPEVALSQDRPGLLSPSDGSGRPLPGAVRSRETVASSPMNLVLRLADVGPGYVVGDDGGCGRSFGGEEGTPRALVRLEHRHRFSACDIELNEIWSPAGASRPRDLHSSAFVFGRRSGPRAALRVAASVLQHAVGPSRRSFKRWPAPRPVGDQAIVLETGDALVGGRGGRPGVAVVWRTGRVLAFVFEGGLGGSRGREAALALAERQQARIVTPTRLGPRENDDLEVPLDDPAVTDIVRWLGRRHDPPGPLPRVALTDVFGGGPGSETALAYRGGVALGIWRPPAFARFRRSRLGRLVWHSPCATATRMTLPEGHADIYKGYGPPADDEFPRRGRVRLAPGIESGPCPKRPRNRVLAHVYFRTPS